MTKKHFKENLLRGRGCCVQAVQKDPKAYEALLLWACGRPLAFDPQCEGSRAWYLYQMICCFADKTPFLEAATNSFIRVKSNCNWELLYFAELLLLFAQDENQEAWQVLWCKYETLYAALMRKKMLSSHSFPQCEDFEMLCVVLAENKTLFLKIAEDIGRLYERKPFYAGFGFDWLYAQGKRFLPAAAKDAERSKYLAKFLSVHQEYEEECLRENRQSTPPQSGIRLSLHLRRANNREALLPYIRAYVEQCEPEARARALTAFCRCPYPDDPAPIIEDTSSGCGSLQKAAWEALACIRHPAVRDFVMGDSGLRPEYMLPVLIKNYQAQDAALLERLVRAVPVDFHDRSGWHRIQSRILNMTDDRLKAPAPLLSYIYETTYCSCCRAQALYQMGHRRLLTDEILRECLFDSDGDIRRYTRGLLKRRLSRKRNRPF